MAAQTGKDDEYLLEVPTDEASQNEVAINKILELLDPSGQSQFWKDVREKSRAAKSDKKNASHEQMTNEVRADNITTYFQSSEKDPVVGMMTDWYDTYEAYVDDTDLYLGFEKQITKLANIIINHTYQEFRETNAALPVLQRKGRCKYSKEFSMEKGDNRTVLQLCAEGFKEREISKWKKKEKIASKNEKTRSYKRDFTAIARCILENDPEFLNIGNPTPLELALKHRDDNMAALLIEKTRLKSRVRNLFETHHKEKQKFKFKDIIDDPNMKKTVIAVLDCTVSKDWSDDPGKDMNGDNKFHIIADDPLRYHFFYQILDGDQEGRPARLPCKKRDDERPAQALVERDKYSENPRFQLSISCLQALCQSQHRKAVSHPTVRSLARRKWDLYGRWRIRWYAFSYASFLVLLTLALSLAVISKNPKQYPGKIDKFRAFCELLTILVNCIYLGLEVDQLLKEGCCLYVKDYFNWVDVFGIFGILLIIPLRFANKRSQWIVAALAYIFNFLRMYKYLPAWKSVCVYSRTLAIMIKKDLKVFASVYVIVLMTFCGATFLSLRGLAVYDESSGFKGVAVSGFGDIFLRGIRALTQSEGFTSEYGAYKYHMMQGTKRRHLYIVLSWLSSFLLGSAILIPTGTTHRVIIGIISAFFIIITLTCFVIHVFVIRKAISKECIMHIVTIKNKRIIASPCTPREKRIIKAALWSVIPFLIFNVPYFFGMLIGHDSVYLALLTLLDGIIIDPILFFISARKSYRLGSSAVSPT